MSKKLTKTEKEAFSAIGRLGGKATVKKHGKGYMRALGKKGALARRKKK